MPYRYVGSIMHGTGAAGHLAGVPVARARGFLKELDVRILRTGGIR